MCSMSRGELLLDRDGRLRAREGAAHRLVHQLGADLAVRCHVVAELVEDVDVRSGGVAEGVARAAVAVDGDAHPHPLGRGVNVTGIAAHPPSIDQFGYSTTPPSSSSKSGTRWSTRVIIVLNSSRARCEPGQRWMPTPNET